MASETRPHNERRGLSRWFVPHPSFGWYLRGIGLGALFSSSFFGLASWYYNRRLLDALGGFFADPGSGHLLATYATLSMLVTAVGVVGAPLFVLFFSSYFLHRISGPIYRIQTHMQKLIDGAPASELVLRKDDQLQELCQTYNQLLAHLELLDPKPDTAPPAGERAPEG